MTLPAWTESRVWRLFALGWLAAAVLAVLAADALARRDAEASVERQAATAAALHAAVLRSELERQRATPFVLARDADLLALLASPTPARVAVINAKFEALAREVRAAALYVLTPDGTALAASNWREPTSFVGSNYRFRPYYGQAMRDGQAAFFALGTVSGRPGLYLARRIDDADGRPLGVIVAKVEFDALEQDWRASGEPAYVTDREGVVLITTQPAWRFRTALPLSTARRRALAQAQTTGATLIDLPFQARGLGVVRIAQDLTPGLYAHAADAGAGLGWTVHLLSPADAALSRARGAARSLALLSVALLAAASGLWLQRRRQADRRAVEQAETRAELERLVDARTSALSDANRSLKREADERRRLDRRRQDLEDELVQANKLATLGQIAAGVAHEINQPLAAIRTHADTAAIHLNRGASADVARSLTRIGELTDRAGSITDELRAFARKTGGEAVAVDVEAAIDGALLLAGPRLRERGVTILRQRGPEGLQVRAERNRLEQVVLNLVQNAIEAMAETPDPTLDIAVDAKGRKVAITVADTGPGVSDAMRARLFTPFATDKPTGLGLGLVISRDIVASFGGELTEEARPRGAAFRIVLGRSK